TGDCSGPGTVLGQGLVLIGGQLDALGTGTLDSAGAYSFRAVYNGDSTYESQTSACVPLTVQKVLPTFTVELHDANHEAPAYVPVGEAVHAAAQLSGALGQPTGTVQVEWFSDGTCSSSIGLVDEEAAGPLDPAGPAITRPVPGAGSWLLYYKGDAYYRDVESPCLKIVWRAIPTVTLKLHDAAHHEVTSAYAGTTLHPRVIVAAGFGTPSGQVTVKWSKNGTCSSGQTLGSGMLSSGTLHDVSIDVPL